MHLLARETTWLDEADSPVPPGQSAAELIFLSFSDSDLGAVAAAWTASGEARFGLRVADLKRLRHPMSVDLYIDQVVAGARFVCARLLGGLDYWRYGAEELAAFCRRNGIVLALLPGDGRDDPRLAELATLPVAQLSRIDAFLREGGPANTARLLRLAAFCAGLGPDHGETAVSVPAFGVYREAPVGEVGSRAVIVFYRAYLHASDLAPIDALIAALCDRGLAVEAVFVASLKAPGCGDFVAARLRAKPVAVVLNATGFSAGAEGGLSPLTAAGAPVLQLVLSGSTEAAWQASARGLSQTDLAMQVVLPELDGTLLAGAVSFKERPSRDGATEFAPSLHASWAAGIEAVAARAAGWARLAATSPRSRRIAIVLSDYPGGGQAAHAVGLDTLASLHAILGMLEGAGYATGGAAAEPATFARLLCEAEPSAFLSLDAYENLSAALPEAFRRSVESCWGAATGTFRIRFVRCGNMLLAVQPNRGRHSERRASYHDPDLPPCHAYVAFHLWLRSVLDVEAILHLGTHGTLEWLPGKAAALSPDCAPLALLSGMPVIYPFIVNNPGEAAAAKRRLGAVTIGHLTPPLVSAGLSGEAQQVERLLEEYAAADGLDARRAAALRRAVLERAEDAGLLAESGARPGEEAQQALARLDAYLCDLKDLQIRDGLHVFGCSPVGRNALIESLAATCTTIDLATISSRLDASPAAERAALLAALDGRFVPPGPAGAPSRGRIDVLPTGRNITASDLRAIPQPSALALAEVQAQALLRRHLQDHGAYPRLLLIDLWGSATLRTGGEDFALALVLLGARPVWDAGSGRVSGIEVLPLALLDRPRIDVALRISGLFRDQFAVQIGLYQQTVRAIAAREEPADLNPLVASGPGARIWGPAPACYGAGPDLAPGGDADRAAVAESYLRGGGTAYGAEAEDAVADQAGFAALVATTDALIHPQDHAETDLLDGDEHAAHVGGFAAAAAALGAHPLLYQLDSSRPTEARVRSMAEEVARVVRGRAANPRWIEGQMRHGYRGAAEIARALDGLHGFAMTLPDRLDRQFDLLFDATLGDEVVDAFLRHANTQAREAMAARFRSAIATGLWRTRRNRVADLLDP